MSASTALGQRCAIFYQFKKRDRVRKEKRSGRDEVSERLNEKVTETDYVEWNVNNVQRTSMYQIKK